MSQIFEGINKAELELAPVLEDADKREALENLEKYINGEKISNWKLETLLAYPDIPLAKWMDEVRELVEKGSLTEEDLDRAEKKMALVEAALANAGLNLKEGAGDEHAVLVQEADRLKKLLEKSRLA
ncbi:MAG: hypothetical protein WC120_05120 [Parcubacteria group bacterium]